MVRTIYLNWRLKRRLFLHKKRYQLLGRWRKLNAAAVHRADRSAIPRLAAAYCSIRRNFPAWP